jgi:hypothetical protein
MPAKSIAQQKLMGQAYAVKKGEISISDVNELFRDEVQNLVNSMTLKQLKDFAKTKHAGLPNKVEEQILEIIKETYREYLIEKYKKVIRNKKVKRKKICRPGYKSINDKCVKMSSNEKRNRKKSARKARSKRRASKSRSIRKRKKSLAVRKRRSL